MKKKVLILILIFILILLSFSQISPLKNIFGKLSNHLITGKAIEETGTDLPEFECGNKILDDGETCETCKEDVVFSFENKYRVPVLEIYEFCNECNSGKCELYPFGLNSYDISDNLLDLVCVNCGEEVDLPGSECGDNILGDEETCETCKEDVVFLFEKMYKVPVLEIYEFCNECNSGKCELYPFGLNSYDISDNLLDLVCVNCGEEVDLPGSECGDNICDTDENCDSCPQDCLEYGEDCCGENSYDPNRKDCCVDEYVYGSDQICCNDGVYDVQDCNGVCFEDTECIDMWGYPCEDAIGDSFCDDGAYGINFNCNEWNYDDGDCEGSGCVKKDCDNNCFGFEYLSWIGDGFCDVGQYGFNFNCNMWDYDGGDCECIEDSDCNSLLGNSPDCIDGYCKYIDCEGDRIANYDCEGVPKQNGGEIVPLTGYVPLEIPPVINKVSSQRMILELRNAKYGNPNYMGSTYGGCWDDDPVFGDGICHTMFNCDRWNYDQGDCILDENGNDEVGSNEDGLDLDTSLDNAIFYFDVSEFEMNNEGSFDQEYMFIFLSKYYDKILKENVEEYDRKIFLFQNNDVKLGEISYFKIPVSNMKDNIDFIPYEGSVLIKDKEENVIEKVMNTYQLEQHELLVTNMEENLLTLNISSDNKIILNLELLEEKYVDLNFDGSSDILIKWIRSNEDGSVNIGITYLVHDVVFLSGEEFGVVKREIDRQKFKENISFGEIFNLIKKYYNYALEQKNIIPTKYKDITFIIMIGFCLSGLILFFIHVFLMEKKGKNK